LGSPSNAMTEIALALAMGFFSIMIVAMVSLGAGTGRPDGAGPAKAERPSVARLVEAVPDSARGSAAEDADNSRYVIYHDGQFLDREMAPVDPASVQRGDAERVVLALPPDLPMQEVLAARQRFEAVDPVVAALTEDWMEALRRNQ